MKKTLTNSEVEAYVATLSAPDSFMRTLRMPQAARQAIRVNLKTLTDRLRVYEEGRKDILDQAVKAGKAKEKTTGRYTIPPEHQSDVNKDLRDLAEVKNELSIECFDVDAILESNDLTLAEEDVILFFKKGAED